MKTILEETKDYILYHHVGKSKFQGCQCFKDCSCREDFIPQDYNYYSVKKLFNKIKTHTCKTLEEARERIDFLNTLPRNYYQDSNKRNYV